MHNPVFMRRRQTFRKLCSQTEDFFLRKRACGHLALSVTPGMYSITRKSTPALRIKNLSPC